MTTALPDFSKARVLVAGDLMLDRYWHGETSRISPEAPVPVVRVTDDGKDCPGGAGNVALNIAALGAYVRVDGLAGNDDAARTLHRLLSAAGVTCQFENSPALKTIMKLRVLSKHQQLIRLDFEDGFYHYDTRALLQRFSDALPQCDVVVLSDYAKGTLSGAAEMIRRARTARKPVLVDPKGRNFDVYRGATLLTPNTSEFTAVVGEFADDAELHRKGEQLRERLELDAVLVTRGEHGMTLIERGKTPITYPAQAREVFDVTGAGDTVIGVLAAALAAGAPLADAARWSNTAAGIVVGKLGAATVSADELRSTRVGGAEAPAIVVSQQQVMKLVRAAKARGEKIVMTNGCFDILHVGHLRYLQQARLMGDRLIVAVNDDGSVTRLKGASRPMNPLADRMAVLAGLRDVDWVVPFSEDTPERLICDIMPDVLVKGGDYQVEQIAGHQCVQGNGGMVVTLDLVAGVSTTGLIERVRADRPTGG